MSASTAATSGMVSKGGIPSLGAAKTTHHGEPRCKVRFTCISDSTSRYAAVFAALASPSNQGAGIPEEGVAACTAQPHPSSTHHHRVRGAAAHRDAVDVHIGSTCRQHQYSGFSATTVGMTSRHPRESQPLQHTRVVVFSCSQALTGVYSAARTRCVKVAVGHDVVPPCMYWLCTVAGRVVGCSARGHACLLPLQECLYAHSTSC
jgi:hypothetical protein